MRRLIVVIISLFSLTGFTSPVNELSSEGGQKEKKFKKKIYRGDSEVGGNLGMYSSSNSGFSIFGNATARYFIRDKVALGGSTSFSLGSWNSIGIGPSLAYYFMQGDRWATYIGQDIHFQHNENKYVGVYSTLTGTTKLGVKYFLLPSIALDFNVSKIYDIGNLSSFGVGPDTLRSQVGFSISL